MNANFTLVVLTAVLYSVGIYLLLERSLTRVVLGVLVLSNATNLLLLSAGGPAGRAPITGLIASGHMSDPLVEAMILTAIVITLGLAAFLLALVYRNWQLDQDQRDGATEGIDELVDDAEDLRIAVLAANDEIGDDFEDFQEFGDDTYEDGSGDIDAGDSGGVRGAP